MQCVAALPKGEKLEAEDEEILAQLEIIRHNAVTLKQIAQESPKNWSPDTGKGKETADSMGMGFGQKVGQLCRKHPNIVLAPLFPELTTGTITLYGCKNIIAAPEK